MLVWIIGMAQGAFDALLAPEEQIKDIDKIHYRQKGIPVHRYGVPIYVFKCHFAFRYACSIPFELAWTICSTSFST